MSDYDEDEPEAVIVEDDSSYPTTGTYHWHAEVGGTVTTCFEDDFVDGRVVKRRMVFPVYAVPTKPVEDVKDFMDAHLSGCCLHIALSDENLEDDHIKWCLERANEMVLKEPGDHEECLRIARLLTTLSEVERWNVHDMACGICCRPQSGPEAKAARAVITKAVGK